MSIEILEYIVGMLGGRYCINGYSIDHTGSWIDLGLQGLTFGICSDQSGPHVWLGWKNDTSPPVLIHHVLCVLAVDNTNVRVVSSRQECKSLGRDHMGGELMCWENKNVTMYEMNIADPGFDPFDVVCCVVDFIENYNGKWVGGNGSLL